MPPARDLVVGIVWLDEEPITGLWCEPCALPSAIGVDFAMTLNGKPHSVRRVTACLDCGTVNDG